MEFCQLLFAEREEGDFRWTEDERTTEVLITDAVPVPLENVDKKPIVQLVINGYQSVGLAIDQRLYVDALTGERSHVDLFAAQASFFVHAKLDETARRVSRIIAYGINQRRHTLLRMARLHHVGQTVSTGPTSPPGALVQGLADVDSVVCTVSFQFQFLEYWKVRPQQRRAPVDPPKAASVEVTAVATYKGRKLATKRILEE